MNTQLNLDNHKQFVFYLSSWKEVLMIWVVCGTSYRTCVFEYSNGMIPLWLKGDRRIDMNLILFPCWVCSQ